ncbi:unnamed protein product [Ectocarpus sp. CCAP 1310/34]|nr:unnamed protein product [Ectocarpus sp. CCAP 1310/34]
MAATPARYRKEGHLGAAAGEGSSARGMLPGISGIPSALHTPDPSPPPARAAIGAGSSGPPKMAETLLDIMRDEEVGGIGAGSDDVGGDDGTGGDSSSDHSFDTQHPSSNNGAATGSSARTALDAPVLTVVMEKGKTPSRAKSPSPTPQQSVASAMTQRSLKRNQNKPYSAWPVSLLQIAIQARGISGLSRERSSLVLEKALADVDKVCGRPSPYYADLEDKATGETPASKPLTASPETVEVPETLVMAVRSVVRSGASINPKKMMDLEENAYLASRLLEVIADEDRASGAGVTTAGRRKSKHCVPRAVELMVAERFRERLAASRTQLSRTELDNKETGNKRSVYFELWKDFKDTDVEEL